MHPKNQDKKTIFIHLKKFPLVDKKIFIQVIDFLMLKKPLKNEQMNM